MRFILYLTIQISQINNGALLRYLLRKSMDWFLYDNGLRHERVKSQISVTTVGFELQIFCKLSSYLTHLAIRPNRLGEFGVPEFTNFRQEWLTYIDLCKDTSTSSQVSNWDGAVLEIYLDHKFQWLKDGLKCESLTYEVLLVIAATRISDYSWFLV